MVQALGEAKFLVQAAAHGVSQGVLSVLQGGDFVQGFASGALGSLGAEMFGQVAGSWSNSTGGQILFGALSGGVGAELSGGNFWQGAVTGGIVAGLNHQMHKMELSQNRGKQKQTHTQEQQLEKTLKNIKVGDSIEGTELSVVDKDASNFISKITRLSETEFAIKRTLMGRAGLDDNAKIVIKKFQMKIDGKVENGYRVYVSGVKTILREKIITNFFLNNNEKYFWDNKGKLKVIKN